MPGHTPKEKAKKKAFISKAKKGNGSAPGKVKTKDAKKAEKRKMMKRKAKLSQVAKSTGFKTKKKKTKKPNNGTIKQG